MNLNNLLRLAKTRYSEDGLQALAKRSLLFGYRKSALPFVEPVINSNYEGLIINTPELKSNTPNTSLWQLEEALDNLLLNHIEDITPLQDESLEIRNYPSYVPNEPFVATRNDITVFGPHAMAVTSDGRVIAETINSTSDSKDGKVIRTMSESILSSPYYLGTALIRGTAPSADSSVSTASILYSRYNNFYHWTLEHLLKLRGIAHYEKMTEDSVTLVVPPNPPSFVIESLELLGYDEQYTEWNGNSLHVNRLVVPSYPELTPNTLGWLREQMFSSVDADPDAPDWVYISRQNDSVRRVANYGEVKSILDKYGVEPIRCEELSMREEVSLFRGVDGVVAPHGAGLTASVWCSNATIVELFNDVVKAPYYILADALDQEYTALSGQPVGDANKQRDLDIRVDIADLEQTLRELKT